MAFLSIQSLEVQFLKYVGGKTLVQARAVGPVSVCLLGYHYFVIGKHHPVE